MRCAIGIHSFDGEQCGAKCRRCDKERGHVRIALHVNDVEERSNITGRLLRTTHREWRECSACGFKYPPHISWKREEPIP